MVSLTDELQQFYGWSPDRSKRAEQEFLDLINSPQQDYVEYELKSSPVMNMTWRVAKERSEFANLPDYSQMIYNYENSSVDHHHDESEQKSRRIVQISSFYSGECIEILSDNINDKEDIYSITEVYFNVSRKNQLLLDKTGVPFDLKKNDDIFLVDTSHENDENQWIRELTVKIFQDLDFLHEYTLPAVFSGFSMHMHLKGEFHIDFYFAKKEGSMNAIQLDQSLKSQKIKNGTSIVVQAPSNIHILFIRLIPDLEKSILFIQKDEVISVSQFKKLVQKRLSLDSVSFYLNVQGINLINSSILTDVPNQSIISLIPYF